MTIDKALVPLQNFHEALRGIDMARMRELAEQPPGEPTRAGPPMVTARSADAAASALAGWEQEVRAQEYCIPLNHAYDISIRVAVFLPVVQGRQQ